MIDAKTRQNAIEVEKLQKIQNKDVNTARDLRLNSIRGTILVPLNEFKNEENLEERIQGHLQQQNIPVSNVTIFKKNSWKGNTLTCACITFESSSMPASVRVGFEKVKEDIPKPRQCHACWKLGHAKKHYEGIPCCPICGTLTHTLQHCPHHGDCSYRAHCPNCNEDGHTPFSTTEFFPWYANTQALLQNSKPAKLPYPPCSDRPTGDPTPRMEHINELCTQYQVQTPKILTNIVPEIPSWTYLPIRICPFLKTKKQELLD